MNKTQGQMKRRVLFAIGEMSGGGSQRQLLGILHHLDRNKFIPELYVISAEGELLAEVPDDVPIHMFAKRQPQPVSRFPGAGFRAQVRDFATCLKERKIDVIYDRTYHMTMITGGATKLRPTPRVSVIVTDPKLDFETNPERFRWIKRRLLRRAYHNADTVAAVSEGVRLAGAEYYRLPAERVETCYNFFDLEQIAARASQKLPSETDRKQDSFLVVAAGRLHPQKGFDLLIEATRRVVFERDQKRLQVWILGVGNLQATLTEQIEQANLQEHVHLLGFHENPLPFYREADLFCLSSRYEGMPNALVEAMICKTPVLSTNCPSGPEEVLQQGKLGGLIDVEDCEALANSLQDAMTNQATWRARIEPAYRFIEKEFALSAGIERVSKLITKTMSSNLP